MLIVRAYVRIGDADGAFNPSFVGLGGADIEFGKPFGEMFVYLIECYFGFALTSGSVASSGLSINALVTEATCWPQYCTAIDETLPGYLENVCRFWYAAVKCRVENIKRYDVRACDCSPNSLRISALNLSVDEAESVSEKPPGMSQSFDRS